MEAEPSIALAKPLPPTTIPESAMTIDYENDVAADASTTGVNGHGADAEMGDQDSNLLATTAGPAESAEVEEAEMADDEASTWEKDAPMIEETESVIEVAPATSDLDLNTVTSHEAETTKEALTTSTSIEGPSPIVTAPTQVESTSTSDLPVGAASLPFPVPPEFEPASLLQEEAALASASNGGSLEQQEQPVLVSSETTLDDGEQADAEQSDFPVLVKTVAAAEDPSLESSTSSTPFLRPQVDKALLLGIEIPFPESTSPSNRLAPAVLFTYDNTVYSLFQSHKSLPPALELGDDLSDPENEAEEEDPVTLFTDSNDQQLYFGALEQVFSKLHDNFPELHSREDELVLDFDEIGVALAEDNVYSQQVSLHDFDRIHLGCGLPGRLHARLYAQSRFSSGFNALAQHVANSLVNGNSNGVEGGGNDSETTYEAEDGTVNGDEEEYIEESFVTVGEPPDLEADGPDSELPAFEDADVGHDGVDRPGEPVGEEDDSVDGAGEARASVGEDIEREDGGENEEENLEEEEFDLESALAQLDGDDIAAYAEGAAEDYILSEGGEQQARPDEEELQQGEDANQDLPTTEGNNELRQDAVVAEPDQALNGEAPVTTTDGAKEELDADAALPGDQIGTVTDDSLALAEQDDAVVAQNAEDNDFGKEPVAVQSDVVADGHRNESDPATSTGTSSAEVPQLGVDGMAMAGTSVETEVAVLLEEEKDTASAELAADDGAGPSEHTIDPNEVIIDYDEVFDGSTDAAVATPDKSVSTVPNVESIEAREEQAAITAPASPKRRHDSLDTDEAGELAKAAAEGGDAKRPRLDEISGNAS